ncbi:hypothetical protein TNCV_3727661 [Trichonephila clavipes]|uniref:Uncharacterized protein n=1 Tax=Trichonephila clavipes TaxID=2585209 RepID=A0A8X6R625_TRICX|nr:hypothetical protein TNCV_3727661 [Trichonephila clavipes]
MNETTQQEKTTRLSSRNETTQLANRNETIQFVSRDETTPIIEPITSKRDIIEIVFNQPKDRLGLTLRFIKIPSNANQIVLKFLML